MGTVYIREETCKEPLQLMGKVAGISTGADTSSKEKNIKRAVECIKSEHGRVMDLPVIYMRMSGYSIAVMREFYTHIGGMPVRLQDSTRYIDYERYGFSMVYPKTVKQSEEAMKVFDDIGDAVMSGMKQLKELGVAKEDYTKLLPLASYTNVDVRMDLREMIHMSHVRLCNLAYHEFRQLMRDAITALSMYSPEWKQLVDMGLFVPQCEYLGYCPDLRGCGKKMSKAKALEILSNHMEDDSFDE